MKHANCGGELKKQGTTPHYRCEKCGTVIKFGGSGQRREGYVQAQLRALKEK